MKHLRVLLAAAIFGSASIAALGYAAFASSVATAATATTNDAAGMIERGRYLARTSGCNDCHTPHYAETGGGVAEREWLVGSDVGWRGPWGTTYPSNLRNFVQSINADQWVTLARNAKLRPPMPWFALRDMSEYDLRALYCFIHELGPRGTSAPAWLPPGRTPQGPYIAFPDAVPASTSGAQP